MFYGNQVIRPRMQELCNRLDEWALMAPEHEKERMREHYMISCQLEYMFFDMAYKLEQWPVDQALAVV